MKAIAKVVQIAGIVLALSLFCAVPGSQAKLVPKIDNFIIFPDQSGSMFMHFGKYPEVKEALAKKLLLEMNNIIPELGYKGSLYMFAPFKQIQAPMVYERNAFATSIQKIPVDLDIFGRLTPMGPGIRDLDKVLNKLSGKTAIILISDGMANLGPNPVMEAKAIHDQFPQTCFHVISFADEKEGQTTLDRIAQIGNCVNVKGADLLQSKAALEKFVRDVFYEEVSEQPKAEKIILRGIHFDFDKYNIKSEWMPILDEAASILKDHPSIHVVIQGYTDGIGTQEYNQKLSERRANAVYRYLVSKGVSPSRMKTIGYGKLNPIADNSTDEGRAINRRVELKVVE
jgi:OOP family OmpA-OmpF porin